MTLDDFPDLRPLFEKTYQKLLLDNEIDEPHAPLIKEQTQIIQDKLKNPRSVFFGSYTEGQLSGFAGILPITDIITDYFREQGIFVPQGAREIGGVYIGENAQGQGHAKKLLEAALDQLHKTGTDHFLLDAVFNTSQSYWTKLLGTADHILLNYWRKNDHHMIWVRKIEEILSRLQDD